MTQEKKNTGHQALGDKTFLQPRKKIDRRRPEGIVTKNRDGDDGSAKINSQRQSGAYKLGSESDGHTQGEKTGERDRGMLM